MWALVPIKQLEHAKSRLAPALDRRQRQGLVRAMLLDVLTALRQVEGLSGIAVVTGDPTLDQAAAALGARVLSEPDAGEDPLGSDLNRALESARSDLGDQAVDGLLVVPADVPLLRPAEIEELLALGRDQAPVVVVAPDRDGHGTNALLQRPGTAIPFLFGPESAEAHLRAARDRGIAARTFRSPGLELDVDEPEDLERLRRPQDRRGSNATRELVTAWRKSGDDLVALHREGAGA